MPPSDTETARARLLDASEELFYSRGIQTVGMDDIRSAAGLPLKRVYALYPTKSRLVEAYLERRDIRWRARIAEAVSSEPDPRERVLALFDRLGDWFREPGFRGCAWINGFGELGAVSEPMVRQARAHKQAFADYVAGLVADAGLPDSLAPQLVLLAEGAMVSAAIFGTDAPARQARDAAAALVASAAGADSRPRGFRSPGGGDTVGHEHR
ncbi:TetR/AcrR family transcriptional regulator [Pseudonocardia sp. KRD291]|uniref:TetR/AcrR family transcriptional regulator n=1 Tax=Pseudonocardia sp. KRD291 TaxID=2792007 RepID=UPI001C4A3E73|nr:TetR/AcrR family transcriptional regulator [Pseudonocardia sp. KRD291]MBW0103973.1 TetR/AcrR family transcriptional regulator [Pseudonocardia sp. KRD291]